MATISGSILFDGTRTAAPPTGMTGIANVPVVLQNIATGIRLTVITDASGNYSFINVPDGNYRVVEAYHDLGVPSPGDFSLAVAGSIPSGVVPPVSFVQNPPSGATDLDCTTPNTLLITVSGTDLNNLYICNGPVRYIPIESITDACAVISPQNLLVDAESGTMGFFPQGTPANTGVPTEPYPDNVLDFTYVLPQVTPGHAPEDGEYTVQNIMNDDNSNTIGAWWRIADRTTGNETGRMMVVNGDTPGSVFFTEDVSVTPNTHYLFSAWILNLFKVLGWADPALGVQILDENGQEIYSATLGAQIPVNTAMPEWKQIGTVINSYDNTNLTVRFLSEGPAAIGNDYAIDNLALEEIHIPVFTPHKTCSDRNVTVGNIVTYTVTLTNTCSSPLTEVTFKDLIPDGLAFVVDSVTINGTSTPGANPETGFSIPDIPGGNMAVVTFQVIAESVPDVNPTINQAEMAYQYTPVEDGIPGLFNVTSNEVALRINPPWCPITHLALQRERNLQNEVAPNDIMTFDTPLVSIGNINYQSDGSIDITQRGTYIVAWFVSGMVGFATDGQLYKIKKFDYGVSDWSDFAGASNHIKVSSTAGFAVINVTDKEIADYGRATIALFNCADADIELTFFQPKAGILVYGADFQCINNRMITIENNLYDLSKQLQEIEQFLYLSDVTEIWSNTQELLGLGVAVIYIGYNYNFWGIGELNSAQSLVSGEAYYLIKGDQYLDLTYYQGDPTIGTLWIEAPNGSASKYPLRFDGTGIYIIPNSPLELSIGTKFSFTQSLILVSPKA